MSRFEVSCWVILRYFSGKRVHSWADTYAKVIAMSSQSWVPLAWLFSIQLQYNQTAWQTQRKHFTKHSKQVPCPRLYLFEILKNKLSFQNVASLWTQNLYTWHIFSGKPLSLGTVFTAFGVVLIGLTLSFALLLIEMITAKYGHGRCKKIMNAYNYRIASQPNPPGMGRDMDHRLPISDNPW